MDRLPGQKYNAIPGVVKGTRFPLVVLTKRSGGRLFSSRLHSEPDDGTPVKAAYCNNNGVRQELNAGAVAWKRARR